MLNQLAQVFSSSGVYVPGSEYVRVPRKSGAEASPESKTFGPIFDQASAKLELSKDALKRLTGTDAEKTDDHVQGFKGDSTPSADAAVDSKASVKAANGQALSEAEQKQVKELAKRDREVKAHESAHKASGGGHTGAATYEYQNGPDGKQYAVGGHVSIDAGPVSGNPEATLRKAQALQRAALAPADPSGQDRAVAAAATKMAMDAQKEKIKETMGGDESGTVTLSGADDEDGFEMAAASARDPRRAYGRESSKLGAGISVFG